MRTPTALPVALALALAVAGVGAAAGAAGAVTADGATTDGALADGPNAGHSVDEPAAENFSVRVKTPRTIAKNVTQNYSVAVSGADGDVDATWTFESATANGTGGVTKNGTTVQHAWADGGNATITVTVVDESGASTTKELAVTVVEYGSADDDPAGSTPFRFLGSVVIILLAMGIVPALLYVFVLPTVMAYLTDEFS